VRQRSEARPVTVPVISHRTHQSTTTMEDVQSAVGELKKAALENKGDKKAQDAIGHFASYLLLLVSSQELSGLPNPQVGLFRILPHLPHNPSRNWH
jgi:hypothetical protein